MMMHSVQVIDTISIGGAEKLLVTFALQARRVGDRVTVIGLKENISSPFFQDLGSAGAEVISLPGNHLYSPGRFIRLVKYLKQHPCEVVHTHLTFANILGTLAAAAAGVPAVSTLHNETENPNHYHPLRSRLESFCLRYISRHCIAVGSIVAEKQQARFKGKPLIIVPNAVDPIPPLSPAERSKARIELTGRDDLPIVLAVGRLSNQKGYPDLIEAFRRVIASGVEARLVIVGGGGKEEEIKTQIHDCGLQQQVILTGRRADVPRLLAAGDIFASASHWEGLPVAVLEAMSAGLPVAATAVGELPRIIDESCGLLVPPHEPESLAAALLQLLTDQPRQAALGRAAAGLIEQKYKAEVWYERLQDVYRSAAGPAA
jgi:glycosyltransferase involved in cell wall biosynthesis